MVAIHFHRKSNWIYLAFGDRQPFAFFGASGWMATSPRWIVERTLYEIRRRFRVVRMRAS